MSGWLDTSLPTRSSRLALLIYVMLEQYLPSKVLFFLKLKLLGNFFIFLDLDLQISHNFTVVLHILLQSNVLPFPFRI